MMEHLLTVEADGDEVLAWCECGWSYAAPDANAALDAHQDHVRSKR